MRRRNAGATSNTNSQYRRRVVLEREIREEVVTGFPFPAGVFNDDIEIGKTLQDGL